MIANTPYSITGGASSKSIAIAIHEESDGGSASDKVQTGMTNTNITACKYWRQGGTVTTITTSNLTNLNDAYSSGGFKEAGDGWYRLDLPNAAIDTGADWVVVWITTDTNNGNGSVRINLTAEPADVKKVDTSNLANHVTGYLPADVGAVDAFSLSTHASGVLPADVRDWTGTAVATPDTAGYPKVTVKSGTGTGEISLSAGLVVLQDGSITTAKFAGNAITAAVIADGTIDRATFATDTGLQTVRSNTLPSQAGMTSVQIKLDAGASAQANFYVGDAYYATSGSGIGQCLPIVGYDATNKVITVAQAPLIAVVAGDTYAIKPAVYGSNTIIFV